MLHDILHPRSAAQRRSALSVLCMSMLGSLLCLLAITADASPTVVDTGLTVRATSELSTLDLEKRREFSEGQVGLYSAAMSGLGAVTATTCKSPLVVPLSAVCIGAAFATVIGGLAGIWAALSRDLAMANHGLLHLYPGNSTHSAVGVMVATLPPYQDHLVAYHVEDSPYTKYALYFRHNPDVGTKRLRAFPQGADFNATRALQLGPSGHSKRAEAGGVYVDYEWQSVNTQEEKDFGNDQGDMDGVVADMLNTGAYTKQGLFCMNYYKTGNADRGVAAITQGSPYPWQAGQSEAIISTC